MNFFKNVSISILKILLAHKKWTLLRWRCGKLDIYQRQLNIDFGNTREAPSWSLLFDVIFTIYLSTLVEGYTRNSKQFSSFLLP